MPHIATDTLSVSSDDGELSIRFTAEAPELHDLIFQALADVRVGTIMGRHGIARDEARHGHEWIG